MSSANLPSDKSVDTTAQQLQAKRFEWLMAGLLVLAGLFLLSHNIADPDLWGHVQYGQDVLRDRIIHPTTTYSFTANGYRWINHENISEIVMAIAVNTLGTTGLLIGKFLLAVFVLVLMIWCARKKSLPIVATGLLVLLVASNLAFHWSFRPQLLSFFFCTIMLWILDFSFDGWQERYLKRPAESDAEDLAAQHRFNTRRVRVLWLMPLVLCLWANSHGGFVAGVAIYLAYLAGRTIEAFWYRGWRASGMARRFAMMGIVGVLGTLINPYGPGLHHWMMGSLGTPRPEITDWYSVSLFSANGSRMLLAALLVMIAIGFTKRKRDWTQIAILALVCWQSLEHVRHIAFFALLVGFWIPAHLASTLQQTQSFFNRQVEEKSSVWKTRLLYGGLLTGYLFLSCMCLFQLRTIRVDKQEFPVEAFQYVADQQIEGRMVVTYNWAQYAIGTFGGQHADLPHCPVAFDGRFRTCYPQQIVDMHFDFVMGDQGPGSRHRSPLSPPINDSLVLKHRQPEIVLISRRQKPSVRVMQQNSDRWTLLYQDEIAQIWGATSRFGDPTSSDYVPESQRKISDSPQRGSVPWPALPRVENRDHRFATLEK
jgi:hypothetical protein